MLRGIFLMGGIDYRHDVNGIMCCEYVLAFIQK